MSKVALGLINYELRICEMGCLLSLYVKKTQHIERNRKYICKNGRDSHSNNIVRLVDETQEDQEQGRSTRNNITGRRRKLTRSMK
jgi:hypothetical protein